MFKYFLQNFEIQSEAKLLYRPKEQRYHLDMMDINSLRDKIRGLLPKWVLPTGRELYHLWSSDELGLVSRLDLLDHAVLAASSALIARYLLDRHFKPTVGKLTDCVGAYQLCCHQLGLVYTIYRGSSTRN